MRSAAVAAVITALTLMRASGVFAAETLPPAATLSRPSGGRAQVVVNSQESLAEAVGDGFPDEAWEYPAGLLPDVFPGLVYVSGPTDRGLAPKGAWRKPVVLQDKAAKVEITINCYHAHAKQVKAASPGTPFASFREADYQYAKADFHGLRSATASDSGRDVFVFRDGDRLFKVEAAQGEPEPRRKTTVAAAEAIWKFRHPE